jgi:hypothetical protein
MLLLRFIHMFYLKIFIGPNSFFDSRNDDSYYKLTHTSEIVRVRTLIMTSDLIILTFLSIKLKSIDEPNSILQVYKVKDILCT